MKVGDLITLRGSMWSSYDREGETGIILDMAMGRNEYEPHEFSEVLWNKDGQTSICKTDDLSTTMDTRNDQ